MSTIRVFKHYIRFPFLLLAVMEGILFYESVYLGAALRFGDNLEEAGLESYLWPFPIRALVFAAVLLLWMMAMGLYQAQRRDRLSNVLIRLAMAFSLATATLALLFYIVPTLYIYRGLMTYAIALSLISIVITRTLFAVTINKDILKRRVLIYGAGERAAKINTFRRRSDKQGLCIVGYVHVPNEHDVVESEKVIHLDEPLGDFAARANVDEIVVAVNDRRRNFPVHELLDCRLKGIDVIEPITFMERETGKLNLDLLHPSWLIFSDGFRQGALRSHLERLFDIVVSATMLVLTAPILVLTAFAIWVEGAGRSPIFYRQVRIGQDGAPFELLKFRSMRLDAERDGVARWASDNDNRTTRIGRIIRKYRIDELPQIINILHGDMSLVGPRPERPEFVTDLERKIPLYSERHRVKPGLAGWAQMKYPYGSSDKDAKEKLQYDLYYVKNHGLFLDLYILLHTAEVVFFGKGAR